MRALRTGAAVLAAVVVLTSEARAQFGPTPIYTEPVERRPIRRTVEIVGVGEARRRAVIGAETSGRVQTMEADAGDYVQAEGVLCRIRTKPVALSLEEAKGRLASARAGLTKMEAGYRKEDVAQGRARLAAAKADLDRWAQEYKRTRNLLADGASTQAEMDAVQAAYRTAQERLAEATAGLALLEAGYRIEDVAKAKADVVAEAAAVAGLEDTLEKMTVRVPFPAFVVRKMCEEGEWLSPGSPVAEVVDLGVIRIQLDVPERYLKDLSRGATAPVVFPALGTERQYDGRISQIVPASAEGTHTVTVRVDVENAIKDGRPEIAAGLQARAWLPVGPAHEALLVPKAAVIRQLGRDVVYTVQATPPAGAGNAGDGQGSPPADGGGQGVLYAVRLYVNLVGGYGRFMEVESPDLKPGMPLVTRGTYLMEPGAPVKRALREQGKGPRKPNGGAAKGDGARRPESLSPGGRGQGEGDHRAEAGLSPSPHPSPVKGEGVTGADADGGEAGAGG